MERKKINFKKNVFNLLIILNIFLLILFFFMAALKIPKEINFKVGQNNNFNVEFPFSVSIEDKSIEVDKKNKFFSESVTVFSNEKNSSKVTFSFLGVPVKTASVNMVPTSMIVPSGETVGINIKTDGIMVLGTGFVNSFEKPWEGKIKAGDLLLKGNEVILETKEQLIELIEANDKIIFEIKRDDEVFFEEITAVKGLDDGKNKIGLWVRDSTQGIGTLTYYNPTSGHFGALGHGILDVDTNNLMTIRDGKVMSANIASINKGEKGSPGELIGEILSDSMLGKIKLNTKYGIYGNIEKPLVDNLKITPMEIGLKNELEIGNATILSNIVGGEIKSYDILISEINLNSNDEKAMIIEIVDEELLEYTNGIIQGMSGSPIIQNNKIFGAVTHVFVQDPKKGYGIFIETMLSQENNIDI